tara:strand:- start:3353 stop:4474 length:1122 start_codon:yes stop_codon:yes gene_type:complete
LVKLSLEKFIENNTDHYFRKTKEIIKKNIDVKVTYAVFMRRPVLFCPRLALKWFKEVEKKRKTKFYIKLCHKEGDWVGAGDPLMYVSGYFSKLVDLETIYLQLIGPSSVAAYNAYIMSKNMPKTGFLAMDARHCAGAEMHEMMAYGASVGSKKAKNEIKAVGFIGTSCSSTANYFGKKQGLGTMPHAFIGFAKSTLRAAQLFYESFPKEDMTVLVDYFGKEISDTLEVCNYFNKHAKNGKLSIRLDTHGGRYLEGLDIEKSYEILEKFCPNSIKTYRNEQEMKWLVGTGVSVSSIFYLRNILDKNGWKKVKIVASSGFNPQKCLLFANTNAPIDVIGTGSYIPNNWEETYATADIIKYNNKSLVKKGREFLIK